MHVYRFLKQHGGLSEPISNVSKKLIDKGKSIRVLLDTGLSGDTSFLFKKGLIVNTYLLRRGLCHNHGALPMASFKQKGWV